MPADFDTAARGQMTCPADELGTLEVRSEAPTRHPGGKVKVLTLTLVPNDPLMPPRRAVVTVNAEGVFEIEELTGTRVSGSPETLFDGIGVA